MNNKLRNISGYLRYYPSFGWGLNMLNQTKWFGQNYGGGLFAVRSRKNIRKARIYAPSREIGAGSGD